MADETYNPWDDDGPAPEVVFPKYADNDPDRLTRSVAGVIYPEPADVRARRKAQEVADAAAQAELALKLEADPDSTQGLVSEPTEEVLTGQESDGIDTIEAVEAFQGFRFGDPDGEATTAQATRSLICRDPECPNQGEQIAVHPDTAQPVRCGGCGAVLLCDHVEVTTDTMSGTLGAPVQTTTTSCAQCGTVLRTHEEPQPPVNLSELPVGILETPLQ